MQTVIGSVRTLSLHLLGPAEVRVDGQPVAFATRKTLALLAYLVVVGGTLSRDRLTSLFWPDSDIAHGRAALRNTLAYLRAALGEDADRPGRLRADRSTLAFERLGASLDLELVEAAAGSGTLESRLEAAATCRGAFLEGLALDDAPEFDEWLAFQRQRWQRQSQRVFAVLLRQYLDAGSLSAAQAIAERWLVLDPYDERALRGLMETFLAGGDPDAAQRAFIEGRRGLERGLGVSPAPATEALAERARLALRNGTGEAASPGRNAQHGSGFGVFENAYVGRAAEHQTLVAEYHAARAARVLVLEGEAGIGKTRLATEFLAWAAAQGAPILRGQASPPLLGAAQPAGGRLPYEPLVEALRRCLERENAPDDLLADVWLAEIGRVLPEVFERYPDLSRPSGDEGMGPSRLFEAVVRLVDSLSKRAGRPAIVFVDDLQWTDVSSLDLLRYSARRWAELGSSVLVLFTLREAAAADWLASLQRDVAVRRVPLEPLTVEDTLRWVAAADAGAAPSSRDAFGRWLFGETHGQPFFVAETLKMLVETGILAELEPAATSGSRARATFDFETAVERESELRGMLPPRVREVVRARLAQLSQTATTLLAAAAVLAHGFTFETLSGVAGLGELESLDALDELVAGRLLRPDAASAGVYVFGHDKIREAVYDQTGSARRQILHRRALEILEGRSAPAAYLAEHARGAGLADAAFRHSVAAGDAALGVFAVSEAIVHYTAARAVAQPPSDAAFAHLSLRLGRAYELSGAMDSAEQVYDTLLAHARANQLDSIECLALNRLATVAAQARMDLTSALELLNLANAAAERGGSAEDRAETDWNFALVSYYARALGPAGLTPKARWRWRAGSVDRIWWRGA
jgi:DNA-binding SARP family transcriptional activator